MNAYLSVKIKIVSFLAIVLVIWLHSYNLDPLQPIRSGGTSDLNGLLQEFISNGITRIAVPIFFLISGFLFFTTPHYTTSDYLSKLKSRFRTLFLPFFIWSFCGILFYLALQSIPAFDGFFVSKPVRDFSVRDWITRLFINPVPYQFWFVRDLICLVLLSPLLFFGMRHLGWILILGTGMLWLGHFEPIRNSSEALLFFCLGGLIRLKKPGLALLRRPRQSVLLLLIWIGLIATRTAMVYYAAIPMLVVLLHKMAILIGIVAFWSFYDRIYISNSRFLTQIEKVTGYTFFIFAFHEPLLTFVKKLLFALLVPREQTELLVYLIAPVFTILFTLFAGILLKRISCKLFGVLTGGR